jgi:hypothetical protein
MSCISVEVWPVVIYNLNVSITEVSSRSISVHNISDNLNVNAEVTSSSILITSQVRNGVSPIVIDPRPSTISISLGIVCTSTAGIDTILEVIEGRLITIDGQYIKVLKNGV